MPFEICLFIYGDDRSFGYYTFLSAIPYKIGSEIPEDIKAFKIIQTVQTCSLFSIFENRRSGNEPKEKRVTNYGFCNYYCASYYFIPDV